MTRGLGLDSDGPGALQRRCRAPPGPSESRAIRVPGHPSPGPSAATLAPGDAHASCASPGAKHSLQKRSRSSGSWLRATNTRPLRHGKPGTPKRRFAHGWSAGAPGPACCGSRGGRPRWERAGHDPKQAVGAGRPASGGKGKREAGGSRRAAAPRRRRVAPSVRQHPGASPRTPQGREVLGRGRAAPDGAGAALALRWAGPRQRQNASDAPRRGVWPGSGERIRRKGFVRSGERIRHKGFVRGGAHTKDASIREFSRPACSPTPPRPGARAWAASRSRHGSRDGISQPTRRLIAGPSVNRITRPLPSRFAPSVHVPSTGQLTLRRATSPPPGAGSSLSLGSDCVGTGFIWPICHLPNESSSTCAALRRQEVDRTLPADGGTLPALSRFGSSSGVAARVYLVSETAPRWF